jgi:hypothetical protein
MTTSDSVAVIPELTPYPDNSPEAMLRVITLFVVSDGELADEEMDTLETLGVLQTLGVNRERFALVFDTYCDDLIAHAGTARYVGVADADCEIGLPELMAGEIGEPVAWLLAQGRPAPVDPSGAEESAELLLPWLRRPRRGSSD